MSSPESLSNTTAEDKSTLTEQVEDDKALAEQQREDNEDVGEMTLSADAEKTSAEKMEAEEKEKRCDDIIENYIFNSVVAKPDAARELSQGHEDGFAYEVELECVEQILRLNMSCEDASEVMGKQLINEGISPDLLKALYEIGGITNGSHPAVYKDPFGGKHEKDEILGLDYDIPFNSDLLQTGMTVFLKRLDGVSKEVVHNLDPHRKERQETANDIRKLVEGLEFYKEVVAKLNDGDSNTPESQ